MVPANDSSSVEDDNKIEKGHFKSTEAILGENLPGKRPKTSTLDCIDEKIRHCTDYPGIIHWICLLLLATTLWGIIYSLTDKFVPGTQLFGMFALFITAYIAGELTRVIHLPPLLGMLLMGLILRNTGIIHFTGKFSLAATILRHMALFIILTRAGLGLDPKVLKNLSLIITRLAFGPAFIEGVTTMIFSHYLLGLPWIWGALLGSILAAVSPAVVIPCLFALQEKGYGVDKGIPTLVVAAASLDDIFSISAYGIIVSVIFSHGTNLTKQITSGPVGLIFGVILGIVWGIVLHYIPHKDDKNVVLFRVLLLAGGGLMVIYGSDAVGYPGAGPLGCIIAPVIASLGWRKDGWSFGNNPVARVYGAIWVVFQPILFGLIGAEVDVTILDAHIVGFSLLTLACSLIARILVSVFVAYGGGFTWKEKIFVAWAWFPKATVQAALGPIPLEKARENNEGIDYAEIILISSVLAILITAPIGAILITLLGPRLLNKTVDNEMSQIDRNKMIRNESAEKELDF